jgi:hypothetical protein
VSQPTRAEFQRLLASGALFEEYAALKAEQAKQEYGWANGFKWGCWITCAIWIVVASISAATQP